MGNMRRCVTLSMTLRWIMSLRKNVILLLKTYHNVPEKKCHGIQKPVQKYKEEQECHTSYRKECNTRYEQSCHTVTERQCTTVTEKECSYVNGQEKCWDEPREKCWDEPRQQCEQVPKEDCKQVPKQDCQAKSVPYTDYLTEEECNTINKPVARPVPVSKCRMFRRL